MRGQAAAEASRDEFDQGRIRQDEAVAQCAIARLPEFTPEALGFVGHGDRLENTAQTGVHSRASRVSWAPGSQDQNRRARLSPMFEGDTLARWSAGHASSFASDGRFSQAGSSFWRSVPGRRLGSHRSSRTRSRCREPTPSAPGRSSSTRSESARTGRSRSSSSRGRPDGPGGGATEGGGESRADRPRRAGSRGQRRALRRHRHDSRPQACETLDGEAPEDAARPAWAARRRHGPARDPARSGRRLPDGRQPRRGVRAARRARRPLRRVRALVRRRRAVPLRRLHDHRDARGGVPRRPPRLDGHLRRRTSSS